MEFFEQLLRKEYSITKGKEVNAITGMPEDDMIDSYSRDLDKAKGKGKGKDGKGKGKDRDGKGGGKGGGKDRDRDGGGGRKGRGKFERKDSAEDIYVKQTGSTQASGTGGITIVNTKDKER